MHLPIYCEHEQQNKLGTNKITEFVTSVSKKLIFQQKYSLKTTDEALQTTNYLTR